MGGLTVATLLTIFFVPALYAAWFKVGRQSAADTQHVEENVALACE
jgi:Cu/Ag efflux pump CusA